MLTLKDLPDEIIVKILHFLFTDDAFQSTDQFKVICKADPLLEEICVGNPLLRYQLALNALGMVDGDSNLDAASKLEQLNRREHAWRSLSLDNCRRTQVRIPFRASHIYDLSAGVYLLGECKTEGHLRDTHTLRVLDLRQVGESGVPPLVWPEVKVDAEIVDIAFCLHEHDLLAVVGQRPMEGHPERCTIFIFLIELSTGKPHPYARESEILVGEALRVWGKMSIMVEIVGPKLVLLMSWRALHIAPAAHDCLILLQWQKGILIIAESAPHATWTGFVFVTPDMIMLPNLVEKKLEMVHLPDKAIRQDETFTRIALFDLAPLTQNCVLSALSCRCEPNPFGIPYKPSKASGKGKICETYQQRACRPLGAYQPDPKRAVILLQVYVREMRMQGHWPLDRHNASLVIHRHELLRLTEAAVTGEIGWLLRSPTPESLDEDMEFDQVELAQSLPGAFPEDEPPVVETEDVPDLPLEPPVVEPEQVPPGFPELPELNVAMAAAMNMLEEAIPDWVEADWVQQLDNLPQPLQIPFDDDEADDELFMPMSMPTQLVPIPAPAIEPETEPELSSGQSSRRPWQVETDRRPWKTGRTVRWKEWEHATRWIADDAHVSSWITVSAGQRYVGLREDGHIIVKDFQERIDREAWDSGLGKILSMGVDSQTTPSTARDETANEELEMQDGPDEDEKENVDPRKKTDEVENENVDQFFPDDIRAEAGEGEDEQDTEGSKTSEDIYYGTRKLVELSDDEQNFLRVIFQGKVPVGIPCQEYVSDEPVDFHGIMMDEERIIGLKHDDTSGAIVEIEVIQF